MSNYTRSVVPGRGGRPPSGRDLDRLVFGDSPPAGAARKPEAANEDESDDVDPASETFDDDLPIRPFADRSARDRRDSPGRRQADYSRLPDGASFRTQDGGSSRGMLMLVAALVVVGVFGAVVWNAYSQGVRTDGAVTAPRLAEDGPFKVRPEPAEATESAALEATVFERFEGPSAKPDAAEAIAEPTPETRPAPPVAQPAEKLDGNAAETSAPAPAPKPAKAVDKPAPTPKPAPQPAATPAPAATQTLPPVETAASGFTAGGKYLVQIGASASEAGADQEWSRWKGKGGALFTGAEKIIVSADVGGRTVYRIRVGSFATAEAADSFCAAFKGKGGDCFRATR